MAAEGQKSMQECEALARRRRKRGEASQEARESGSGEPAVAVAGDGLVTFGAPVESGGVSVTFETPRLAEVRAAHDVHL